MNTAAKDLLIHWARPYENGCERVGASTGLAHMKPFSWEILAHKEDSAITGIAGKCGFLLEWSVFRGNP